MSDTSTSIGSSACSSRTSSRTSSIGQSRISTCGGPASATQPQVVPPKSVLEPRPHKLPPLTTAPSLERSECPTLSEKLKSLSNEAAEILDDMFDQEHVGVCRAGYLSATQSDVDNWVRSVLVDWLVEIHQAMLMQQRSLFLAVSLLDRYLSKCPVKRKDLQLVGITCLCLAAKYEEVDTDAPTPGHFHSYVAGSCCKKDIVKYECRILAALGYDITHPTMQQFLEIFQEVNGGDAKHTALVSYILELSMLDSSLTSFAPSQITAGAFLIANEMTRRATRWSAEMASVTKQSELALGEITKRLSKHIKSARDGALSVSTKKYSKEKQFAVAKAFAKQMAL